MTAYCKTLFFRRILISRFPYVENSLHFNFADFPVNFIKQFVSYFFWCLKCYYRNSSRIIVYITHTKNIAYHVTQELIFYADKIMVMGSSKNHVYLILRFYLNRESRENSMLAKYTCFTISRVFQLASVCSYRQWQTTVHKNISVLSDRTTMLTDSKYSTDNVQCQSAE